MSRLVDAAGRRVKSTASSGICVEAVATPIGVLVRDSKDRTGPVLDFGAQEWAAFGRHAVGAVAARAVGRARVGKPVPDTRASAAPLVSTTPLLTLGQRARTRRRVR